MLFRRKSREETKPQFVVMNCVATCPRSKKCPLWVELVNNYRDEKSGEMKSKIEGKCAIAWLPHLLIELRYSVDRLVGKGGK